MGSQPFDPSSDSLQVFASETPIAPAQDSEPCLAGLSNAGGCAALHLCTRPSRTSEVPSLARRYDLGNGRVSGGLRGRLWVRASRHRACRRIRANGPSGVARHVSRSSRRTCARAGTRSRYRCTHTRTRSAERCEGRFRSVGPIVRDAAFSHRASRAGDGAGNGADDRSCRRNRGTVAPSRRAGVPRWICGRSGAVVAPRCSRRDARSSPRASRIQSVGGIGARDRRQPNAGGGIAGTVGVRQFLPSQVRRTASSSSFT